MPTFYRVVKTNPPTLADFRSDKERGKAQPSTPELARLWDGLSVADSEDRVRKMVQRFPAMGSFIAAIAVPEHGAIRYERTVRRPGHYTLWGDAAAILERVQSVTPV